MFFLRSCNKKNTNLLSYNAVNLTYYANKLWINTRTIIHVRRAIYCGSSTFHLVRTYGRDEQKNISTLSFWNSLYRRHLHLASLVAYIMTSWICIISKFVVLCNFEARTTFLSSRNIKKLFYFTKILKCEFLITIGFASWVSSVSGQISEM